MVRLEQIAFPLALLLTAAPAMAQEGGIEVFAAETLFASGTRVSVSHIYLEKNDLYDGTDKTSDPLDQSQWEHRVVASVDHGVGADLTLTALIPYVWKKRESNAGDIEADGAGDVALLAKYRFYKRDWKRGALNLAVIGGLETPTGETKQRDGGSRVPPKLQPGLGAWNPFGALSLTTSHERWRFDSQLFYKENTEGAQDFENGDFLSLGATLGYRYYHTKYPGPTASARVGIQWRHEEDAKLDGSRVNNGADEIRLRPGLGWHPRPGIDVSLTVDLPVYRDYDGEQLALDFRTFVAVGMRF